MSYLYIYNPRTKRVQVRTIKTMKHYGYTAQVCCDEGFKSYFSECYSAPETPKVNSRDINVWLQDRDDKRAVDILRKARLEKVVALSKDAAKRLHNLQVERDFLVAGNVEVTE